MKMSQYVDMFRGKTARFLVPLVLTLVWTLVELASLFIGGVPAINPYWVVATLARLAMIGLNLWFVGALFRDQRSELYGAFRKYVGYAVVLGYGAVNLPIMAWQADGLLAPGGTLVFWLVTAVQAILMMAIWLSLRLKKSQVYWGFISAAEAKDKKLLLQRQKETRRGPLAVVLENGDMFIQTVFIVILLQQFIFQLYVIPSESLVPTMLKYDRPFIVKSLDGPVIPMSGIKLPAITEVKRGQIVVFESPAYQKPPLFIEVAQQFVFYLTLSLVNLDRDESGKDKVHYVVKRVTGEPGEKLMMVDDVLYTKKANDPQFTVQKEDAQFSHVDLWKDRATYGERIEDYRITEGDRAVFERWDQRKNGLDTAAQAAKLAGLSRELQAGLAAITPARLKQMELASFNDSMKEDSTAIERQYQNLELVVKSRNFSVFQDPSNLIMSGRSLLLVHHLASVPADRAQLAAFLTSGATDPAAGQGGNAFQASAHHLNLLYKELFARQLLAVVRLVNANAQTKDYGADKEIIALSVELDEFQRYLGKWDDRNFPEFPSEPGAYIPEGKYFLMGDNRYNSLDFRYADPMIGHTQVLDASDAQSMVYTSYIAPRLLDRSGIIGHLAFRAFPFDRFGLVK